jgi:hypothetical protein
MMLQADTPRVTDWIAAVASVLSVLATLAVGIGVAVYSSGYRVRVRAYIDKRQIVRVEAQNKGRIDSEIGPAYIVVRHGVLGRLARRTWGRLPSEGFVGEEGVPNGRITLSPGHRAVWHLYADVEAEYDLPRRCVPVGPLENRTADRRELRAKVDCGLYHPRYRRLRELDDYLENVPKEIAKRAAGANVPHASGPHAPGASCDPEQVEGAPE